MDKVPSWEVHNRESLRLDTKASKINEDQCKNSKEAEKVSCYRCSYDHKFLEELSCKQISLKKTSLISTTLIVTSLKSTSL